MEKVKVSLEIANAMKELESWIGGDKDRVDKVLKVAELLAYGYEVEQTPEEKIFNYYEQLNEACYASDMLKSIKAIGEISGMQFTLNALGIQIKGVNE